MSECEKANFEHWPEIPDKDLFNDWATLRKAKKAPITKTVLKSMGRELYKLRALNISVEQALEEACAAGWQGFKAEWVTNRLGPQNISSDSNGNQSTRDISLQEQIADRSWAK